MWSGSKCIIEIYIVSICIWTRQLWQYMKFARRGVKVLITRGGGTGEAAAAAAASLAIVILAEAG